MGASRGNVIGLVHQSRHFGRLAVFVMQRVGDYGPTLGDLAGRFAKTGGLTGGSGPGEKQDGEQNGECE